MRKDGFTLVELIIVITILGIMAAIVVPTFQGNVARAKESASKSNLSTMRSQIELYRIHHSGFPPGYVNGDGTSLDILELQLTRTSTVTGLASASAVPTAPFLYGPYLKKIPENPYNKLATIAYVAEDTEFSTAVNRASGWLYKKETGEIMLNWDGVDSTGIAYSNY